MPDCVHTHHMTTTQSTEATYTIKPVGKRTKAYVAAKARTGWHVHTNNAYVGYQADPFADIVTIAEREGFALVWIGGNVLMFEDGTEHVDHVTY